MEKSNKELTVVKESFFDKVRKFFKKLFSKKEEVVEITENQKENDFLSRVKIEEDNEIVSITNVAKKDNKAFSKLDELNSLGFFKTPILEGIKMGLSEKERVIILLKFGFIDGKYYRNEDIAKILKLKESDIIETIQKVYDENVKKLIDHSIEISTEKRLIRKKERI